MMSIKTRFYIPRILIKTCKIEHSLEGTCPISQVNKLVNERYFLKHCRFLDNLCLNKRPKQLFQNYFKMGQSIFL